jgi:hypothetical protein
MLLLKEQLSSSYKTAHRNHIVPAASAPSVGFGFHVSGFRLQVSDFRLQASGFRLQGQAL